VEGIRRVADGMIGATRYTDVFHGDSPGHTYSYRPSGTGTLGYYLQAFHARLLSFSPSGTKADKSLDDSRLQCISA
jgi:hypothetical protein